MLLRHASRSTTRGVACVGGLTRLFALDLSDIAISCVGAPAHLADLKALPELFVANLERCTNIMHDVAAFAQLGALSGLRRLRRLRLSGTPTGEAVPGLTFVRGLTGLRELSFDHYTNFGGAEIGNLRWRTCAACARLALMCCTAVTGAGMAHLAALRDLRCLELPSCFQIRDAYLAHLCGAAGMRRLDLEDGAKEWATTACCRFAAMRACSSST